MLPPTKWTEKWAHEHPRQAAVVLLFGTAMFGIVAWIAMSDGCR